MAIVHVDETYPGLPNSGRLSGTNGDLVGILDIALVANGWAIEYTSGNARVYRPGTGNRFRLHVNDDSATSGAATLAVVRGCENASSATSLTDPFPTVALLGNTVCNWLKSTTANTTARAFDLYVGTTWVFFAVNAGGAANSWECSFFGDIPANISGDSYNTLVLVRNSNGTSNVSYSGTGSAPTSSSSRVWWCRSYDGTVKSTAGAFWSFGATTTIGNIGSYPPAQGGPTLKVDAAKTGVCDLGGSATSATLGIPARGWLPNIWMLLHNGPGSINTRDTWGNSAYNPSAAFTLFRSSNTGTASGVYMVETTDTWAKPSV